MTDAAVDQMQVIIAQGTGAAEDDWPGYPASTPIFVEELARAGLAVEYETPDGPHPVLELRSIQEILLPVLMFVSDVGSEVVAAGVVAALAASAKRFGWKKTDKIALPVEDRRNGEVSVTVRIEGDYEAVGHQLQAMLHASSKPLD